MDGQVNKPLAKPNRGTFTQMNSHKRSNTSYHGDASKQVRSSHEKNSNSTSNIPEYYLTSYVRKKSPIRRYVSPTHKTPLLD